MSGETMRVDYDRLRELEGNLDVAVRVVGAEFENMLHLAAAVGDSRLADRTNGFRDSWDKRRLDIMHNLEWLRDSVKNIHEQLLEVDSTLAQELTAPGPGNSSSSNPQVV